MPIYDRPTKTLMTEWAKQHLSLGDKFGKNQVVKWFAEHYPKIKSNTVRMHVDGMSVNNIIRRHHPSIKPGTGHDLFYKLGPDLFRLWDPQSDSQPLYKEGIEATDAERKTDDSDNDAETNQLTPDEAAGEFAFEKDLQNYLVKNLHAIEPGLRLYEEEGLTGVEFAVGGRFIDVLAVDKEGRFVVIELKVSRGYDRVIGQLLRYMAWIDQNLEGSKPARGIIVANDISADLRLACSRIADVKLIEYQISFSLRHL